VLDALRLRGGAASPIAGACGAPTSQLGVLGEATPADWAECGPAAAAGAPPGGEEFPAAKRALLTATAQIVLSHTLTADCVARLREHLGDQQTVEAIVTAGYYAMLAVLMNGLAIELDPRGEAFIPLIDRQSSERHSLSGETRSPPMSQRPPWRARNVCYRRSLSPTCCCGPSPRTA